jgi:hypothetical protein
MTNDELKSYTMGYDNAISLVDGMIDGFLKNEDLPLIPSRIVLGILKASLKRMEE